MDVFNYGEFFLNFNFIMKYTWHNVEREREGPSRSHLATRLTGTERFRFTPVVSFPKGVTSKNARTRSTFQTRGRLQSIFRVYPVRTMI